MSYLLGESVPLHFELTVNEVDTDAPAIAVTIIKPDGSIATVSPAHDGTGIYDEIYTPATAGHYSWVATVTGGIRAVAAGVFDVVDPVDTTAPLVDIAPWTDPAAIRGRPGCADLEQRLLDGAARAATGILYALSGRQFAGRVTAYSRPNARPGNFDTGRWGALGGYGYNNSWGSCGYAYGTGMGAAVLAGWLGHSCRCYPPELDLGGYPLTVIQQVKINGTVIPADEYRIDDHRLLVRVRTSETAQPTERSGWPTCQRLDLPDTEPGTFSVAFTYGIPPPHAGVEAATSLAAELALIWDNTNNETRLPQRVRTVARQGETVTVVDPQDVLDKGRTGLPDVDLFIKSANPNGLQARSSVWSPDVGRSRRTTAP